MEPRRIGRYQILSPLGHGGMGTVYRARDEVLGRVVALKVLRPRDGDATPTADRRHRFEREARAAAALNHPHIATLYDFGEAELDGAPTLYLAMELVEGEDLSVRLREEPLEPDHAFELAEQICSALQSAHVAGIVHRDLKPSNVRLTLDGRVKVLDFGIAKVIEEPSSTPFVDTGGSTTRSGVILGTLGYLAPEQLRGRRVDGRSDLFSLGAILYEMLSGGRAFPATSVAEYLLAVERGPTPALPAKVQERVPGAQEVVAKLLARDPDERYRDAVETRTALHALRASLPIGSGERARFDARRAAPWLAAPLLLLLAGFWWLADRAPGRGLEPIRVAVPPFVNETGNPEHEAVALGLGFFLSSRLSGLPLVEVLGSSRVAWYPATDPGERRLVAELDVDRVVRGRLRTEGERLVLALQVTGREGGDPLYAEELEAERDDPLQLQERAFAALAGALGRPLPALRPATDSNRAYRHYVVAQQFLESGAGLEDLDTAVHHLEQALAADERFAFAHQALADALLLRHDLDRDPATLSRAIRAAESAVAFDPKLPQAMRTLARALRTAGRVAEAAEWLQKARDLDGRAASVTASGEGAPIVIGGDAEQERARTELELGRTLEAAGRVEDARAHLRRAIQLAPEWWLAHHSLGVLELRQSRWDEARVALEEARRLAPERTEPVENLAAVHVLRGDPKTALELYEQYGGPLTDAVLANNIGTAYYGTSDFERARQYFVLATRLQPGNEVLHVNLGDTELRLGRETAALHSYQVARQLIDERLEAFPSAPNRLALRALVDAKLGRCASAVADAGTVANEVLASDPLTYLAMAFALCDRPEHALRTLERALEARASAELLAGADEFASLRDDPRFAKLVGRGAR